MTKQTMTEGTSVAVAVRQVWYTVAVQPQRGQRTTIGIHPTLEAARQRAITETRRTDGYGQESVDIVQVAMDDGAGVYAPAPTLVERIEGAQGQ